MKSIDYTKIPYFSDPEDRFEVDGLVLPLNRNSKRVGIWMSGGADSTILAYLMIQEIKRRGQDCKIVPIHNIRDSVTKPQQEAALRRLMPYLKEVMGSEYFDEPVSGFFPQVWEKLPGLQAKYCDEMVQYAVNRRGCDMIMSGITEYPTDESFVPYYSDLKDSGPEERKQINHMLSFTSSRDIHPLAGVDKRWVMAQYKRLGLDNLLNNTYSCTNHMPDSRSMFPVDVMEKLLDANTIEELYDNVPVWKKTWWNPSYEFDYVPDHCGKCWWCRERQWAIDHYDDEVMK